jgi:hypothetical protein
MSIILSNNVNILLLCITFYILLILMSVVLSERERLDIMH